MYILQLPLSKRAKADYCPRELRLGTPEQSYMKYVYIPQSIGDPERYYVGVTGDLRSRLQKHNVGAVSHTSKHAPWAIKTYVAFSDEKRAI